MVTGRLSTVNKYRVANNDNYLMRCDTVQSAKYVSTFPNNRYLRNHVQVQRQVGQQRSSGQEDKKDVDMKYAEKIRSYKE